MTDLCLWCNKPITGKTIGADIKIYGCKEYGSYVVCGNCNPRWLVRMGLRKEVELAELKAEK